MTIHVAAAGEGPPVVFVHSTGLSGRQWRRWAEAMPMFRTLALDLPGIGGSGPWAGSGSSMDEDLAAVIEVVREHGPAHLVGHSYGGVLALHVAADHPELVRRVVVYEPPVISLLATGGPEDQALGDAAMPAGFMDPDRMGTEPWLEAFVDWWNGPGAWAQLGEPVRRSFLAVAAKVAGEVYGLSLDRMTLDGYGRSEAPTLLLRSDRVPPSIDRALTRLGSLPNVRTQVVPGGSHMSPLTGPDRLVPLAVAHLLTDGP